MPIFLIIPRHDLSGTAIDADQARPLWHHPGRFSAVRPGSPICRVWDLSFVGGTLFGGDPLGRPCWDPLGKSLGELLPPLSTIRSSECGTHPTLHTRERVTGATTTSASSDVRSTALFQSPPVMCLDIKRVTVNTAATRCLKHHCEGLGSTRHGALPNPLDA